MKMLVAAVAAMAVAAPVAAQSSGAPTRSTGSMPQGSSEGGTDANGERRVCRRIEVSENRTNARRVCMTPAEWRAYNRSIGVR